MASSVDLGRQLEKFVSSLVALDRGLAAARAGKFKPAEEVFARLEAKYRKMAKSKA
jgi:predicted transcriptional regulator